MILIAVVLFVLAFLAIERMFAAPRCRNCGSSETYNTGYYDDEHNYIYHCPDCDTDQT